MRKRNSALILLGLGIGAAIAVIALKKYTRVFEIAEEAIKDKKIQKKAKAFGKELHKVTDEVSEEIAEKAEKVLKNVRKELTKTVGTVVVPKKGRTILKKVKSKVTKSPNKAVISRSEQILSIMKKGSEYTQLQISELSGIPYRTIRREIAALLKAKKIHESGYGKGKRFRK